MPTPTLKQQFAKTHPAAQSMSPSRGPLKPVNRTTAGPVHTPGSGKVVSSQTPNPTPPQKYTVLQQSYSASPVHYVESPPNKNTPPIQGVYGDGFKGHLEKKFMAPADKELLSGGCSNLSPMAVTHPPGAHQSPQLTSPQTYHGPLTGGGVVHGQMAPQQSYPFQQHINTHPSGGGYVMHAQPHHMLSPSFSNAIGTGTLPNPTAWQQQHQNHSPYDQSQFVYPALQQPRQSDFRPGSIENPQPMNVQYSSIPAQAQTSANQIPGRVTQTGIAHNTPPQVQQQQQQHQQQQQPTFLPGGMNFTAAHNANTNSSFGREQTRTQAQLSAENSPAANWNQSNQSDSPSSASAVSVKTSASQIPPEVLEFIQNQTKELEQVKAQLALLLAKQNSAMTGKNESLQRTTREDATRKSAATSPIKTDRDPRNMCSIFTNTSILYPLDISNNQPGQNPDDAVVESPDSGRGSRHDGNDSWPTSHSSPRSPPACHAAGNSGTHSQQPLVLHSVQNSARPSQQNHNTARPPTRTTQHDSQDGAAHDASFESQGARHPQGRRHDTPEIFSPGSSQRLAEAHSQHNGLPEPDHQSHYQPPLDVPNFDGGGPPQMPHDVSQGRLFDDGDSQLNRSQYHHKESVLASARIKMHVDMPEYSSFSPDG